LIEYGFVKEKILQGTGLKTTIYNLIC